MAVVAEDSGLEVAVLGGEPGVRSKRWSGRDDLSGRALDEANNALLLARLRGATDRRAQYVCVAVFWDGVREVVARGETLGVIGERRAGGDAGFGYDPYFISAELGRAFSISVARGEGGSESSRPGDRAVVALARGTRLTGVGGASRIMGSRGVA